MRTFTVDELEDLEVGHDNKLKESVYTGRWTEHYNVVFEADGKLYVVEYEEGLTEYQDLYGEQHFSEARKDNAGGESFWVVDCPEVELYEEQTTVTKWRKVATQDA